MISMTVLIPAVAVALLVIAVVLLKLLPAPKFRFPYKAKGPLLTPAERSFYGVLEHAFGDKVEIFGKVRLADLIEPIQGMSRSKWQKAFNRISPKHVDYLLCSKKDLSIICAIELDDASHQKAGRAQRDDFLDGVFASANIPLLRVPAQAGYTPSQIRAMVLRLLAPRSRHPGVQRAVAGAAGQEHEAKSCPKCSSPLLMRLAKSGAYAGKRFWVCSTFPKCRYTQELVG